MKVVMLGTPVCHRCKSIRPVVEEHCTEKGIEFFYFHLQEAPPDVIDIVRSHQVKQAPAFLIYIENKEVVVISGEDIFLELSKL